jgi:hypothetical protein
MYSYGYVGRSVLCSLALNKIVEVDNGQPDINIYIYIYNQMFIISLSSKYNFKMENKIK